MSIVEVKNFTVSGVDLKNTVSSVNLVEVFENMEDGLEIKRRSWEAMMTPNGKKESQVGP